MKNLLKLAFLALTISTLIIAETPLQVGQWHNENHYTHSTCSNPGYLQDLIDFLAEGHEVASPALTIKKRLETGLINAGHPLRTDKLYFQRSKTYGFTLHNTERLTPETFHIIAPGNTAGWLKYEQETRNGCNYIIKDVCVLMDLVAAQGRYFPQTTPGSPLRSTRKIILLNLAQFFSFPITDNNLLSAIRAHRDYLDEIRRSGYKIFVISTEEPTSAQTEYFDQLKAILGNQIELLIDNESRCYFKIKQQIDGIGNIVTALNHRRVTGKFPTARTYKKTSAQQDSDATACCGAGSKVGARTRTTPSDRVSHSARPHFLHSPLPSRARTAAIEELNSLFPSGDDWQSPFEVELPAERQRREAAEQRQAMREARIRRFAR
jgi:hypothetical protein